MSQKNILPSAFYRHLLRVLAILILLGGILAQTPLAARAAPLRAIIGVTTVADEYDTFGSGTGCSLREAIQAANTDAAFGGCPAGSGADTITLPAGTYTLIIMGNNEQMNATGDLDILSDMTIQGATGNPADVIIRGGSGWNDKIIDVNPLIDRVLTVTISGVTVRDGHNTSDADVYGGGIQAFGRVLGVYTATGTLTLQDCVVTNNAYAGSYPIDEAAGGLLAEQINLTIDNCTFSGNSTTTGNGGGISIIGINENISITNSTFTGNSSPANPGGGIYIRRSSGGGYPSVTGSITLNRNIFTTNSSTFGGAIYLSVLSGGNPVTLTTDIHYSRFAGNTATSSGSGLYYSGEAAVPTIHAEDNWWRCNSGPSAGPCDTAVAVGGTLDANPWIVLRNVPSPAAINIGGNTTLTAGFLYDSDNAAIPSPTANLTALDGLSVTWGSLVHGTLSGQQASTASGGAATATLTNDNTCNNSSAAATVDGVTATGTVTVQCPDLTVTKTNNVGGSTVLPTGWNWMLHVANGGLGYAVFANGSTILTDTLPDSGLTYGTPTVSGATGLTGTVDCAIDGSNDLTCTANGPVQLNSSGSFDVVIPVTPSAAGSFANPHLAGSCTVDPGTAVIETNDANNFCSNTVTVNTPPAITSANTTTFTATVAGSFTVTTTPGYPVAMTIGVTGALPSGVTFTDNGNGTATLAGTPALGTQGNYPITITANNGIAPNAIQSFTLVVQPDLRITSANNTTFTIGSAGTFTVTTTGTPTPSISESGALPLGVTFVDNGNGTGTLSGTPAVGTQGNYPITFTAHNGVASDYTQNFTLTVVFAPTITSANNTTFTITAAGSFTVTTTGFPSPAISETGALPSGVTFTDNGNGTATLAGTPAAGTNGSYPITITAANGTLPDATQDFTLTVNLAATTTAITSDTPDPSVVGQTVTFNYSVSVTAPGAGTPTGNVTVTDGVHSCSGTVAAGFCNITFTTPDVSDFTATYAGNASFAGSASATESHSVDQADTTTTITSDTPDPSVVGQAVTFNYSVNVTAPGAGTPTGDVTVTNGTDSCTGTVAAGSCTITFTTPGTTSFAATYAGDTDFAGSTSASNTHTVNQAGTTTTITSDTPDPSVVGQTVTFNYSVNVTAPGAGTPTGDVTVTNGTDSCTGTVAVGSCTITFTAPGMTNFTATYVGDTNFAGSTSASNSHTVNQAGTTTTITSDLPDPSVVGQTVTFNYSVNVVAPGIGTPTGNVTVSDGVNTCTDTVAVGSCDITFTVPGTTNFTATYVGDTNFAGSTSASNSHTVNQAGTSTILTSDSPDPSVVGQIVTFNYSVSVVAPGFGTPTGNVTVSDGVNTCTDTVAVGSCDITFAVPGTTNFTATYVGDTNFAGSTSASASHTVDQASTTTTITSDSPDPSQVGEPVTVNYTVSAVAPGAGTPTGNVTVGDGTDSCTGTVADGFCTIAFTSVGSKTLTASYAGDTNFSGSTSPTVAHTVGMAGTTIAITSDLPDPSAAGIPLPVNFAVTVIVPGSGTPTGNVTITDGVDSCTVPVATGTCNLTMTTISGRLLTASYSGDANFGGSTSFPEPHMVEGPPAVTLVNSVADTGDGQVAENEHTPVAITQLLVVFNKDMNADTPGDLDDVLTAGNYSLIRDGSTFVPINGVIAYNATTHTATLDVNGGVALPNGVYTLTVSGALRDTLGAPIGPDFVRHFVIDTEPPSSLSDGTIGEPSSQTIRDGGLYTTHFTMITVAFNSDVSNAGGGADTDDVTNPLNYLLLQTGPDGEYDTSTCLAFANNGNLPLDDDIRILTGPVTYSNTDGFVASITLNGGVPLPSGKYQLRVCGTTSIVDLAGNPLNGGADSVLNFSIVDATEIPSTGFAPDRVTVLPGQTVAYTQSDLWLEIPKLGVQMDIVGVPQSVDGTWDVSWLGSNAGWLNGSAYPSWNGNSVLTGHVVDANGKAGPFRYVNTLWYGDKVIVHAGGAAYVYEVRSVTQVDPGSTAQMLKHEELPWVTLVTCRGYDAATGTYKYRVLVRAVLVDVK